MTVDERADVTNEILGKCIAVIAAKGRDYSGESDSLANFKRNAERIGLTKYQIWATYFNKHIDAVNNSIKAAPEFPQVESEPIEERVVDIINYALILAALIREDLAVEKMKAPQYKVEYAD